MHRPFTVLISILSAWWVYSQEIRPSAEFRLGGSYFLSERLRNIESEGPLTDITGTSGSGYGFFGEANWTHGRTRNGAIGVRFGLENTPIGHNWTTRADLVWGTPADFDGEQQGYVQEVLAIKGYGTYSYDIIKVKKVLIQGNIGLGAALLPGTKTVDYSFGFWSIHDDEHPNFNAVIYRMDVFRNTGLIPLYRGVISAAFPLPRQNRLYTEIFYSGSFARNAFKVDYVMYPGTSFESRGKLRQGLGSLGVSLSYGISHGPPKTPRRYERRSDGVEDSPRDTSMIGGNSWTRHAITLNIGSFVQAPFSVDENQMGFETYGHWHRAIAINYEHRRPAGWIFGAEVQRGISGFKYGLRIDHPAYLALNGSPGRLERMERNDANMEYALIAGHELKSGARWRLDGLLIAGLAPGIGVSSGTAPWGNWDTISMPVATVMTMIDQKLNPLIGIRINGAYRLGNHDRITLSLEARSTLTNYYTGYFKQYPDTLDLWSSEGAYRFRSPLAYAGVRIGYAIAWGPPRQPRWMRLQERYERRRKN